MRDRPWDVALLQETRQRERCDAKAEARERGWMVVAGPQSPEDGKDLVWIVIKRGAATKMKLTLGERAVGVVWSAGGPAAFRLYTVYGEVAADKAATEHTAELVRACLADAEGHGQCPALIAGDMNVTISKLGCAAELAVSGWADLGTAATCATGASREPRRIDLLLANRQLQVRAGPPATDWTTGLAAHAVQTFRIDTGRAPMLRMWQPARFPLIDPIRTKEEAWAEMEAAMPPEADDADTPEAAYARLNDAVRLFHRVRYGLEAEEACQPGREIWGHREPRQHNGSAETAAVGRKGRRYRRLAELRKMWPIVGPLSLNGHHIREALIRAELPGGKWQEALGAATTRAAIDILLAEAEKAYEAARVVGYTERKRRWTRWCEEMIQTQPGRVWRWVREGTRQVQLPPVVHDPQDTRGHEEKHIAAIDDWWWELWRAAQQPEWEAAAEHLGTYADFSAFPTRTPWTRSRVQAIVAKTANKAPGADGVIAKHVKEWPPAVLDLMAQLYERVEEAGAWPEDMRRSMVAMLPKKGTGSVDDMRPITLLSVVYRIWGRAHSAQMRAWLRNNAVQRPTEQVGADSQACELAWSLAWGRYTGAAVSGLAIDWSKCYDHVSLELLPQVANAAGVPAWLWKPVHAMYTAPRAIVVAGALGRTAEPTHGITAGCPLAGDWLALIAHMLVRALAAQGPAVKPRPYVDDLTTSVEGDENAAELVNNSWKIVGDFGKVFKWTTAFTKCARFSTSAKVREQLAAVPGPPVRSVFADLGVAQHTTGRKDLELADSRELKALGKLDRMQAVRLDFTWRCRMVGGSGLPTALYGVEASPICDDRLQALCRAAFEAVWKSGRRAAREVVLSILAPWRTDPLAVATVQPIRQLQKLVRSDMLCINRVDQLVAQGDTVGPVAALRDALRRGHIEYHEGGSLQVGDRRFSLQDTPPKQLTLEIVEHHRGVQMAALAKRRPPFSGMGAGADLHRTLRPYRVGRRKPAREACLRLLQAGGAITQQLAADKFGGGSPLCPYCGLEPEDLAHRCHRCPRWHHIRQAELGELTLTEVLGRIPDVTALTGLVPKDPELVEWQRAAENAASWPDPIDLPDRCWSDGSAIEGADPLTSRAGWAVCARVDGTLRVVGAGRVPGRQTSGRAELCALVWVSRCGGSPTMVTDNRGVIQGAARCNPSPPKDLLDGRNGDLWRLVAKHVDTAWIKSHLELADARARGFSDEDHAGNALADEEAGKQAAAGALDTQTLEERRTQSEAIFVYQHMIAAIQAASMDTTHARRHRKRGPRKNILRLARRRPPKISRWDAAPGGGPCPEYLHQLRVAAGPTPQPIVDAMGRSRAPSHWILACERCGRNARTPRGWAALTRTLCYADDHAQGHYTGQERHSFQRMEGGCRCSRCGLCGPRARSAAMSRARCPMPAVFSADGTEQRAAEPWRSFHYGLRAAWAEWARGAYVGEALAEPPVRSGPAAAATAGRELRLRWTPHWIVKAGSREVCVRCGVGPLKTAGRQLGGWPCPAVKPLRAAARVAVQSAEFQQALLEAPALWRDKVRRDCGALDRG